MKEKDYIELLEEIKQQVTVSRVYAVKAVNSEMIAMYWNIGKTVLKRQQIHGWGKSIVDKLAIDLQHEYKDKTGFSSSNIWRMRQLYSEYTQPEILAQLVRDLNIAENEAEITISNLVCSIPWGQNIMIMEKIKNISERLYYIQTTAGYAWSRNVLLNQIKANAYQHSLTENKQHNFHLTLPQHYAEQAEETIKSSYSLSFLGIEKPANERELENKMIEHVRDLLIELGYGFAYLGNQYKIKLGKNKYFIDLLFYHRKLQCLIAIELKAGKFKPEHAAKLNYYLEILDDTVKMEHENPSIGILLCADKDEIAVEYALRIVNKPIGIAKYELTHELPKKFKGELPDINELKDRLKNDKKKPNIL